MQTTLVMLTVSKPGLVYVALFNMQAQQQNSCAVIYSFDICMRGEMIAFYYISP
jgi:hypothetical protein